MALGEDGNPALELREAAKEEPPAAVVGHHRRWSHTSHTPTPMSPPPHHPPPARKPTLQTKAPRSQCVLCLEKKRTHGKIEFLEVLCASFHFLTPKGGRGTHNLFGDLLPPRDVLPEQPLNINHLLQRPRMMGGGGSLPGVRNR